MSGMDSQGETEQSLVAALRQGRQEALGRLYDACAPVMMGLISRVVPDKDLAEEVLQETFVTIWTRIGAYDASKGRLLTWALTIARGLALEAVKKDGHGAAADAATMPDEPHAQENHAVASQKGGSQEQGRCTLTPLEKTVLESLYLRGRTCSETADELNITAGEVTAVLKKAFTHLKAEQQA